MACEELNSQFETEGLKPFFTRFGIHVGDAVVGNLGSTERMNYTALGNTVNLAARLCAEAKHEQILVDQKVRVLIEEQVDLGGPVEARVVGDERLPAVVAGDAERRVEELADRVRLAGRDHVVVGLVLLQHEPHGLDVVAGEAPVARGLEVAERDRVLQTERDARQRVGDLAGDELEPALRRLMVEQDAGRRVQSVRLAVVHGHVVAEHLRHAVRRARVERGELVLGRLAHLAEHLRRRRLVEADRVAVGAADDPHRLEHPQHAERPGDRPLFTEKILIEPGRWSVRDPGAMGGYDVFGTLFVLTGREHASAILDGATPTLDRALDVASGANLLPNDAGVVFRVLGTGSAPVRGRIREFRALVRRQVLGVSAPEPFLWE